MKSALFRHSVLVIATLGSLCVAGVAGRQWGEYDMFVRIINGAYSDDADKYLLARCEFPYPFLKEKIERDGLKVRDRIHPAITGYAQYQREERAGRDGDEVIDIYTYDLWLFGRAKIYITYDAAGAFRRIDESGSAILIGR